MVFRLGEGLVSLYTRPGGRGGRVAGGGDGRLPALPVVLAHLPLPLHRLTRNRWPDLGAVQSEQCSMGVIFGQIGSFDQKSEIF